MRYVTGPVDPTRMKAAPQGSLEMCRVGSGRVGSGRVREFSNLSGRVESGQGVFKSHGSGGVGSGGFKSHGSGRVGSGRVRSGRFGSRGLKISRVGSSRFKTSQRFCGSGQVGSADLTRPVRFDLTREQPCLFCHSAQLVNFYQASINTIHQTRLTFDVEIVTTHNHSSSFRTRSHECINR